MNVEFSAHGEHLEKDMFAGLVTSLAFHSESILLAGHGPCLKVFNVQTGQLLACETVLPHNRIHRIVLVPETRDDSGVQTRRLAVYGSKYLSILQLEISETAAKVTVEKAFGPFCDWIMDAQWLTEEDEYRDQMALAFAHNFVDVYDLSGSEAQRLDHVQCQVRCILYAARFYGNTRDTLILASGTVFNEVHLWKPSERNEQGDGVVYKNLAGHEGVIFGVGFSPDGSMLTSVSDDRTIRVWPLHDTNTKQSPQIIFGHTARVWDCQFVDEYLVSISEDTTCRVWKNLLMSQNDGDDDVNTGIDGLACWEGHAGKNVWSCAISPEHQIVATGGQDSGIRLWSLVSIKENKIDSEDDLACISLPTAVDSYVHTRNDFIRNFSVIHQDTVLAMSSEGHLLKYSAALIDQPWQLLYHDEAFRNYSIMETSTCGQLVVMGSITGDLVFLSPDNSFTPLKTKTHANKVFELFVEKSKDEHVFYVISYAFHDDIHFHRLDISNPSNPTLTTLYTLDLPAERTTIISLAVVEEESLLICGSREAALLIYRLPHLEGTLGEPLKITPSMQLRRTHGRQAISSVVIKPKQGQDTKGVTFWTTGRDGCYIQYSLRSLLSEGDVPGHTETQLGIASRGDTVTESQDLHLEKVYRNKVTKGWLERVVYLDGELLLLGFYRKRFFVHNETKNFELISVACGGAHRRWQFTAQDAKLDKATFAFIRKEQLYAYFRDGATIGGGFDESILQENYHGREVRAIEYLNLFPEMKNDAPLIFATGGEDTLLRLQQYMPTAKSGFVTLASIRKHKSVIKSVACSKGLVTLLFTSGATEELRCWKLEATLPEDPRQTLDMKCLEWATCPSVSEDLETRIMDISVFAIDPARGLHIIGAVYSDAMIRIWLFNEATRRFSMVIDGTWHAKCILQIQHVLVADNDGSNRILFFTSATDGKIAFWDVTRELNEAVHAVDDLDTDHARPAFKLTEPFYHYQAHMSGVNALQVQLYQGNQLLFVTGGDDNALVAALFELQDQHVQSIGERCTIPGAHASSITDLRFVNDSVFSISTDQRLNQWALENRGPQGVSLKLINAAYMDVSDPSAMDVIAVNGEIHVAVTGIGLQSIRYPQ
ncbi:WD40-repeat-containing domain protein [Radiomyces spectabilis]|uniref:WD40-repeat-containing domain protein n=1 Tax=Radiomyces spectabilis TaxID=64574 RepID=UPI00221FA6A8|nr:WD40-repeat-containing domain protein [Radiomyces spectabilis]KAI8369417.1 WD40-repeat-containing domain protein [Radiomyces spectabilis]